MPLKPALYSIPSHRAFSDALVEELIAQHGGDPLGLAQGLILVPNNRAATSIQNAFVRRAENGLLLPRLVSIGDADLGEHVGAALDPLDQEPIPPAIDPLRRQMILAKKLARFGAMGANDAAQAMRLAADLGRVIDQLTIEKKSVRDLKDIDPSGLASHWDRALQDMATILEDWPRELERLGCIDLSERRNRQLDRVAERWRTAPPAGFIVAAGISTTAQAIADLLRVVARLERGCVVLDGLDFSISDAEWDVLAADEGGIGLETHPQYHLRLMLDRLGAARAEVDPWPWGAENKPLATRAKAISHAMAPAKLTEKWSDLPPNETKLTGVSALALATPAEEAQTIALAMRRALDLPGKTIALVTPDRELARRVAALLARWGVVADDSAGQPLSASLPGTLMLLLADALAESLAPAPLLALLKHPLVKQGEERLAWLDGVRRLDLALRGPRPEAGVVGIDTLLADRTKRNANLREAAAEWWDSAKGVFEGGSTSPQSSRRRPGPIDTGFLQSETTPDHHSASSVSMGPGLRQDDWGAVELLRQIAESLCGDAIWSGQEGRALADLFGQLEELAPEGPDEVPLAILPTLLRDLMDGIATRPAQGGHPRLFIWGLIEAKLQSADFIILGGLNEGVWPQLSRPDPWLAPAVRRQLGLAGLERRIGLSAHDLAGGMGAERVLLTRAKRDASAPTVASRFWLRLETLAGGFDRPEMRFDLIARALDRGEGARAEQPAPCPPIDERPRKISVTEVDGLKADPYSFYAKKMLRLSALDAPGEEPDARWRGTFLHQVLGDWGEKDEFAHGKLLPRLTKAFDDSGLHPVVRALWQPRFEEAAANFEARVAEARAEGRFPLKAEVKGTAEASGVKLTGQVDRIDRLPDGSLAIIDYKTGEPPSDKQVKEGFALQLGLNGFLAEMKAFEGVEGVATAFEYWSQARDGERGYGKVKSPTAGRGKNKSIPEEFVGDTFHQFEQAVEKWLLGDAPFEAKLHPDLAYNEFDQLMRYDEWRGRSG